MGHAFGRIAFTPSVKAAQSRDGSRGNYERAFERGDGTHHDRLGAQEAQFIARSRSFYLASVSETGWPYVQHRGGPPGFLKVLDAKTLAFADFRGNRQLVTVGNAAANDRVALILVDYANQERLKVLGRLSAREAKPDDPAAAPLLQAGYAAMVQRVMTIAVEAFDWNCSQHIPQRFEAEDVREALARRDATIAELRAQPTE